MASDLNEIKTCYIDRIVSFLDGSSERVVNNKEFVRIYQIIVNQCDSEDNNEPLYDFYQEQCDRYIQTKLIPKIRGKTGAIMINEYVKCWKNFAIFSKCCHRMLDYLDRYFLKNNNLPLLGENSLTKFKDQVHDQHAQAILSAVLQQISNDRDGNQIELENLKITLQSYVEMGLEKPKIMKTPDGFVWQGDKNL